MQGGSGGSHSVPNSDPYDKNRVLDVKPIRSLKPVFPNANQGQSFVCAPPFAPFSPFYPFNNPQAFQTTPDLNQTQTQTQTPPQASFVPPLRSFRTPGTEGSNGTKGRGGRPKGAKNKVKRSRPVDIMSVANGAGDAGIDFDSGVSLAEKNDGDKELVASTLIRFDGLRRRLCQLEDAKNATFRAAGIVMSRGIRTNMRKRSGSVPGVEVGDIFYFRIEMCLVGLHLQTMAGIDYMMVRGDVDEEPLATSIVSSGTYGDDAEDTDFLIYSGHGGNAGKKGQASDQKLVRGNLALERSLRRNSAIRVIRGVKDAYNQMSKVYVYDGLYEIKETWVDKGNSGCNTFKFKLMRMPGQPAAFAVWKLVQKWKEGSSTRPGLILPDLTSGAESLPVALVNDVDNEKGPAHFTYFPTLKNSESFKLSQSSLNCNCPSGCQPGNLNCSCIRKNGGDLPYAANGVLVSRKPLVYECGPTCPCFSSCKNKVSQTGLKVRLEVFKTGNRGWGLRSWDPIRTGSFLCEFAGEVKDRAKLKEDGEDDDYVFDTTRVYGSFEWWNYEPGLLGEDTSEDNAEDFDSPPPLVISAKNVGNVARFMNHSCSPNVLWQPVVYERNSESFMHIGFFAIRHIPPMQELTYDYGISRTNGTGNSTSLTGKKKCFCGSEKCRGSFG